jgi:AcrR family transcriptional regulator
LEGQEPVLQIRSVEDGETLTARQKDVLDAALALMVEEGGRVTMTAVAQRASCSKETLYKWFGDRHGLLTATVQWQASRVTVGPVDRERLDLASLTARLEEFAANWLSVISTKTSIALNRLAIAHAGPAGSKFGRRDPDRDLGAIVLANGRFAIARRLKPVLEAGRDAGLLVFDDAEDAFRTFFGLVARDVQVRFLLGERFRLTKADIARDAASAAAQFLKLYGSTKPPAKNPGAKRKET